MKKLILLGIMLASAAILVGCGKKAEYEAELQRITCISNMQQLRGAGESWKILQTDPSKVPALTDLCGPEDGKYMKSIPECPAGGEYQIKNAESTIDVTCSVHGLLANEAQ